MAAPQRNFRQEIRECLDGNLPGFEPNGPEIGGFDEVDAISSLRKSLEPSELIPFDLAFRELVTDPSLSVDQLGMLLYYAVTEEGYSQAELEILALRDRPIVTNNEGLRRLIERYIAYREYDKNLHRSLYR